jgi:CBS domain-containing protein
MKRHQQVIAFMTPFPYSVDVDAPLADAHKVMREHNFRHLPVMSHGAVAGILTDRDIKLILGPDFAHPEERDLKVRDAYLDAPRVVARIRKKFRPSETAMRTEAASAIHSRTFRRFGLRSSFSGRSEERICVSSSRGAV